jgi:hypothetical protein
MPRKSAASLAVVTPLPGPRAAPPPRLTPEAAALWKAVVATKPAEWFTEDSLPLLESYCTATVMFREIQVQIDALPRPLAQRELPILDKLLAMREREIRTLTTLARSMRLSQQARYRGEVASTAHRRATTEAIFAKKPWEI